jgi:hypothetical protein
MKRTVRALLALALALSGVLLGAQPAAAGGWAVTILDPLPTQIDAGRAYTVGFWVLQHGSHPFYGGQLEPVGLKLVDAAGLATVFPGHALKEPAHYVTSVTVPAPGTYAVYGVQGPFRDYRIGTLTVPGALAVLPMPPPMQVSADQQPWLAVRPPSIPIDPERDPFEDEANAAPAAADRPATTPATAPAAAPATERTAGTRPATLWTTLAVLLVAAAMLLALGRRNRWSWTAVRRRWNGGDEPRRQLIG